MQVLESGLARFTAQYVEYHTRNTCFTVFQKTNTDFVAERSGQGHAAQRREAVLKELAAAHDAFMELTNNLKEGTKFYNDLTPVT